MQIPWENLAKALLFLRNQVFGLKIWKLWQAATTLQFNIFCWNFAHAFDLLMSTKGCVGFFYFVYTLVFYNFINSSRSKQNKKKYLHPFVDITELKTCAKCQQKILNSMVVNFSDRTKPGFLEIIEVCLNLGIRFCITWLVRPNYKEIIQ